jgi:hypothetical protein
VRQSFVEILGVDGWDDRVSAARKDLHGRLYVRQDISEYFKLRRVGLDVTDRLCESIAFVRSQVVLASGVAERIALERVDRALDDRTSTEPSVRFKLSNRASVFAGSLSTKRVDTQLMTRNVGLTAISLRRWFCRGVVMTRSPSGPLTSSIAPNGRR